MRAALAPRHWVGALLGVALIVWGALAAAADLTPLLNRIEQAYGKKTPPTSIVQRGHTVSEARGEGTLLRAYRGATRFRVDIRYPDSTETRIVDGHQAWQRSRPMQETFRSALLLQAARVGLPWNLLAARGSLRDGGDHAVGAGHLHFIELPIGDGLRLIAEVDPDTGLIRRSRGILRNQDGSEMVFGTIYDDFRSTDGRVYATVEHHFTMGHYIGRSEIESVEFDVPLADALFRPELPGAI